MFGVRCPFDVEARGQGEALLEHEKKLCLPERQLKGIPRPGYRHVVVVVGVAGFAVPAGLLGLLRVLPLLGPALPGHVEGVPRRLLPVSRGVARAERLDGHAPDVLLDGQQVPEPLLVRSLRFGQCDVAVIFAARRGVPRPRSLDVVRAAAASAPFLAAAPVVSAVVVGGMTRNAVVGLTATVSVSVVPASAAIAIAMMRAVMVMVFAALVASSRRVISTATVHVAIVVAAAAGVVASVGHDAARLCFVRFSLGLLLDGTK